MKKKFISLLILFAYYSVFHASRKQLKPVTMSMKPRS